MNSMKIQRLLRGVTQDQLARLCRVHQTAISRLERGALPDCPETARIKAIVAGALGMPVDALFPPDEGK